MRKHLFVLTWLCAMVPALAQTDQPVEKPKPKTVALEQWGHLSGRLVYDGEPPQPKKLETRSLDGMEDVVDESLVVHQTNKGVANILVWLRTNRQSPIKTHPSYEKSAEDHVTLEIQKGIFRPHVLLLRTSQTLVHKTLDDFAYNPRMDLLNNPQM